LPPGASERPGLHELARWTGDLQLLPENLHMVASGEVPLAHYGWIHDRALKLANWHGSVSVVRSVGSADRRESLVRATYSVEVQSAPYRFALATRELQSEDRSLQAAVRAAAAAADTERIIGLMPFSMLAANVGIVTSDSRFAILKRSDRVNNYKGEWCVGISETMDAPTGSVAENFFDLALRGLREEMGLEKSDITSLVVSWFGYCMDCCNFFVFANARTQRTSDEVEDLRKCSIDAHEHSAASYLKVTAEQLDAIVAGAPPPDELDGRWLHHASLAAHLLSGSYHELG
jgi:hypothetical protein